MRFSLKKLAIITSIALTAAIFFFLGKSSVAQAKPQIPERNGVYNDPDHPGIKVRVFVHQAKPPGTPGGGNNGGGSSTPPPPQCATNLTDDDSSATDGYTGWKLPLDWSYSLNTDSVPSSVGSSNLQAIANNAFSAWSSPTGISFSPTANTTTIDKQAYDGVNVVAWGRTQGTALAVTYTRYYSSTGEVVDVDTIMNKKFAWSWNGSASCVYADAYDAQDILTHELGHWVGLDDEYDSNHQNNTMYGYGDTGEIKKDTLATGDKQSANNLHQ